MTPAILFSSAGRRVELIECFRRAARDLGGSLRVVAADAGPEWSPACAVADEHVQVPLCASPAFVPAMLEVCRTHGVGLIVPTIDPELDVYAEHRHMFENSGTQVLVASRDIVRVIRDKVATAEFLERLGVPVPRTWTVDGCLNHPDRIPWPVVVKPRNGSSSKGVFVAAGPGSLASAAHRETLIVQERCPGDEYTVNAFFDGRGEAVCCVPHLRQRVRDGEVALAETCRVPGFRRAASTIADAWPSYYGPVCFQGFRDVTGEVRVFEINGRFGGGYPITDRAGGTFARWILQRMWNREPDYHDQWRGGVRMLRYDAAIFTEESERADRA